VAQAYAYFCDTNNPPFSQRQYAQDHDIPRSTLGYWLRQQDPPGVDPAVAHFFRSPAGDSFLRRLVYSALLVFTEHNACGVRQVGLFLQLSQLDLFVGSSTGSLHSLAVSLETHLAAFECQQRPTLAAQMAPRTITACCDENFHGPHVCLVALEPLSNFLLLQAYADSRDGQTWTAGLNKATFDLPVDIIQLTSDEASGLLRCADDLQAHHSPDLFHRQRDLAGPVLLPLGRQIHQAGKELEKTQALLDRADEELAPQQGCSAVDFVVLVRLVKGQLHKQAEQAQTQQYFDQAVAAVRGLGQDYHPFDGNTGQPVSGEEVQRRLGEHLNSLELVVEQAELPQRAKEAVSQTRSYLCVLAGCVGWFWGLTSRWLEELQLSEEAEKLFREALLPGLYWQAAAGRVSDKERRGRLAELAEGLLRQAWAEGEALARLSEEDKQRVYQVAEQCAGLFCRSTSCVEGRNGRLAMQHHGHTRLSESKLKALTVVHNYLIKRPDGTTAAERFFGVKHPDVFTWLLQRLPELPRPAAKRSDKARLATPAAA
jgi:hypothetical protein